jgi:hypothetical protein
VTGGERRRRSSSLAEDRSDAGTIPVQPLPEASDPLWKLGANVVALVMGFLDAPT